MGLTHELKTVRKMFKKPSSGANRSSEKDNKRTLMDEMPQAYEYLR